MRPKPAKLLMNPVLREYVQDRLAGNIAAPGGKSIAGPQVEWKGRRHGPRQARRWSQAWSPEQIANRLLMDFPEDTSMRISHEAIYQALYVQGRGALRRELTSCLRTGRALRVPRERVRNRGKSFVTPEILISERPASVEDRAVPGHWEGDLILGLASSAIGTGLDVYFCDPQSPWQRGTNENTNGLLRQYFPKGTDLSAHRASELNAVALALNTRPRKTLGWRTPAEAFNELIRSAEQSSVATTS